MINDIAKFAPTERFSDVVDDYAKYRPRYPFSIVETLENKFSIDKQSVVADIGSGTGIFSNLFIQKGYTVFGIEPNDSMRLKSENDFAEVPNFMPIKGSAEQTTLTDKSVDIITAAQAFHWFDTDKTLPEFYRILKDNGIVVLVWNDRKIDSQLMIEYENLLKDYCPDYNETHHKKFTVEKIKEIFAGHSVSLFTLDNYQELDIEGFIGRVKSCSYCLKSDNKTIRLSCTN